MLDLEYIREHPDKVKENNKIRKSDVDVGKILSLDKKRRDLITKLDASRAEQNRKSKTKPSPEEIIKLKKLSDEIKNLEAKLHERIINQKEAIGEVSGALRRRQLALSSEKKPIGSFLFLGPTGVGKTETAKALADIFFKDESKLIRFDMAQYQHEAQMEDLTRELARTIREDPYAILLLDEIEKAGKNMLNLFLSITDEGYFFDENRNKVLCNNLIIIGTSNAASEFIREHLEEDTDHSLHEKTFNTQVVEYVLKKHIFSPEFVNRFDALVVFTPLTRAH